MRGIRPFRISAAALVTALWATVAGAQPALPTEVVEHYTVDALGSVRVVTNDQNETISEHRYWPFGEEWQPVTPQAGRRLFTGEERDAETGLDYFGARYYRPNLGRFTTVDPVLDIEAALVDPQQWNRYAYVRNNPLRYRDPDGRQIAILDFGGSDRASNTRHRVTIVNTAAWLGLPPSLQGLVDRILGGTLFPVSPDERAAAAAGDLMGVVGGLSVPGTVGKVVGATRGAGAVTRNVQGGVAAADDALRGAQKWLGDGYKEIAPGVFRSEDGLRQFRMTASDLADPKLGPHVHFEAIAPDGRTIIENSHVLLPSTP